MGTPVAPAYANIFMGWLEDKALKSFRLQPHTYLRYLDDIFMLWTHGEHTLHLFIEHLNQFHPTIKFTYTHSSKAISFLDVMVHLSNGHLHTSLYKKPTDKHQYLDFASHHPRHCKTGIPYSQIVRLRRICSDDTDYSKQVQHLTTTLKNRHYPQQILDSTMNRAKHLDRNMALLPRPKNNSTSRSNTQPTLVTTFSTKLQHTNKILRKHFFLLRTDPKLRELFPTPPKTVYRRNRNFKDLLMRYKHTSPPLSSPGCAPCGSTNCRTCKHMQTTDTVTSTQSGFTYTITRPFNCKSSNVIYCIACTLCNKQYIGETSLPFHKRLNGHRSDISRKQDTAIAEHFNLPLHNQDTHMVTFILEDNFNSNRRRKYRESFLINKFLCLTPAGLNRSAGSLTNLKCAPKI